MSRCPSWFADRLAWKSARSKESRKICRDLFGREYGPNLADLNNTGSTRIAGNVYQRLDIPEERVTAVDLGALEGLTEAQGGGGDSSELKEAGSILEESLRTELEKHLAALDPGRGWMVKRKGDVAEYEQYHHLEAIRALREKDPMFRQLSGHSYLVKTDVRVGVPNPDPTKRPLLHGCISSKLTIRSDRAQNVKTEFDVLSRVKNGRQPHFTVVTAEPLPTRLASIAEGYGALDAMYHLLFDEIDAALREMKDVKNYRLSEQWKTWDVLTQTGRIRPYALLAATLATS